MKGKLSSAAVAGAVISTLAAAGYAIGTATAPDGLQVAREQEAARQMAYRRAVRDAYERNYARGQARGLRLGKVAGQRRGEAAGVAEAQAELASIAARRARAFAKDKRDSVSRSSTSHKQPGGDGSSSAGSSSGSDTTGSDSDKWRRSLEDASRYGHKQRMDAYGQMSNPYPSPSYTPPPSFLP